MRTGFTVSTVGHVGLIALAIVGIGMGRPIEATPVDSIAVDLVPVSEFANIRMGVMDSEIVETEAPSIVESEQPAELAQPTGNTAEDQPTPADNAQDTPAPTENTAPAPDAAPEPAVEPEQVAPEPAPQPEPQPEPVPEPVPEPEPAPVPEPRPRRGSRAGARSRRGRAAPDPYRVARSEARRSSSASRKPRSRRPRRRLPPRRLARRPRKKSGARRSGRSRNASSWRGRKKPGRPDELANIINNEDSRGATTGQGGEPTLGREDGRSATLSNTEIGALVAQIRSCITLPAGAEDVDARAEFTFTIGPDGMVSGRPQMNSTPANQIEDAYARAVSRALQRCGPFAVALGQDVRAQFAARPF